MLTQNKVSYRYSRCICACVCWTRGVASSGDQEGYKVNNDDRVFRSRETNAVMQTVQQYESRCVFTPFLLTFLLSGFQAREPAGRPPMPPLPPRELPPARPNPRLAYCTFEDKQRAKEGTQTSPSLH